MGYELYTMPNCEKCREVKEILKENDMDYHEVNLVGSGRKAFQEIYRNNKEEITRDSHGILLPILIESEGSEIVKIIQGEAIKDLF